MKSGAISGWTDEDQVQIWSSHSLILQVQIITYINYKSILKMLTYSHSMSLKTTWCSYVILSVANRYKRSNTILEMFNLSIYSYILSPCIIFWQYTGWAIMEELSIRWRVHTFLISWGQKTRVKHCYDDSSSCYEFWFAIICIDMNTILDLSTAIQHFGDRFDCQ